MSQKRRILPLAVIVGAITLMVSAPIVEAAPRSRVRSGNSITIRSGNSCSPSYSSHRSHRTYSSHKSHRHYNNHHRHNRNYGSCRTSRNYRTGVSIRIGGSYGSRSSCDSYGYGYRTYRTYPTYNYNYTYTGCTPVYRTHSGYSSYDRSPSYGTVYTTSSDRYREWQRTGRYERTEEVAERPTETLLPQNDLTAYERNLREAEALLRREAALREREAELEARLAAADDDEDQDDAYRAETIETLEEPPLGSGSTPTSADEEFQTSKPDELSQAWSTLLNGDAATSRALFADAARIMPKKGEARLGYVIASLRDNDRRAASISMVRLLESEPQLVRGGALPTSESLQEELARQSETLKAYSDDSVKTYENRMLIAFVALLQGETSEAQEAMRRSRSAGAEGVAARNLWRLVGLSDKPLERLAEH